MRKLILTHRRDTKFVTLTRKLNLTRRRENYKFVTQRREQNLYTDAKTKLATLTGKLNL